MQPFDRLCSVRHTLNVEQEWAVADKTGEVRRTDSPLKDAVAILLHDSGPACVEREVCFRGFQNADVVRKDSIERLRQALHRNRTFRAEARNLPGGVNASIGSAGPCDYCGLAGQPLEGRLQCALDGGPCRLSLPAAVAGAVVSDIQPKIPHAQTRRRRSRIAAQTPRRSR